MKNVVQHSYEATIKHGTYFLKRIDYQARYGKEPQGSATWQAVARPGDTAEMHCCSTSLQCSFPCQAWCNATQHARQQRLFCVCTANRVGAKVATTRVWLHITDRLCTTMLGTTLTRTAGFLAWDGAHGLETVMGKHFCTGIQLHYQSKCARLNAETAPMHSVW